MQFVSKGRTINVSVIEYLIDWSKKVSGPQKRTKDFLFPFWKNHVVLEEFNIPKTRLRIDLLNITKGVAIEVSPSATHREFNKHFHRNNRMNYVKTLRRDAEKEKWIKENKFHFIELYDEDIDNLSIELFLDKFNLSL